MQHKSCFNRLTSKQKERKFALKCASPLLRPTNIDRLYFTENEHQKHGSGCQFTSKGSDDDRQQKQQQQPTRTTTSINDTFFLFCLGKFLLGFGKEGMNERTNVVSSRHSSARKRYDEAFIESHHKTNTSHNLLHLYIRFRVTISSATRCYCRCRCFNITKSVLSCSLVACLFLLFNNSSQWHNSSSSSNSNSSSSVKGTSCNWGKFMMT